MSGSYQAALEAAGAEVEEFKEFGSYQGDWWARVSFGGRRGWVTGSYSSYSGCDAFEAEFGYGTSHDHVLGGLDEEGVVVPTDHGLEELREKGRDEPVLDHG
jgi:hypothetical protein